MKKLAKTSELLWICGIVFVALGVAICSKADLGVSMIAAPTFVVYDFLERYFDTLTVGVTEYLVQGAVLCLMCLVIRKLRPRYLLAFAVAVIYGYTLNFFLYIMKDISFDATWLRWVMLLVGDTVTAFGVACFFRTYMPLQVYELFVAELAAHFKWNIDRTKAVFDYTLLLVSVALAVFLCGDIASFDFSELTHSSFHSIGLGTIVTTFINAPLIALMGKCLDALIDPTPLLPHLQKALHGEKNKM